MLKVLHFADLHLGVENYGKLNTKTGLNTRVEDFLAAFDFLVATGIKEKVDLVIFTGDAFRDRNPNPTLQREFAKRISKFIHAEIPVVLLVGNHDLPRVKNRANTLEIYKVLNIPGVTVVDEDKIYQIKTSKGYVQIAGIPWDYFLNLFLAIKSSQKTTDLTDKMEEQLKARIDNLADQLDPDTPSILAGHLPLGAGFGSEQELEIELDVFLNPKIIKNPKFDYVALGHMHRFQELSDNPLAIYPGNLEKVDFGERKQDKGFVITEIPQKKDKKGIDKLSKQTISKFYSTFQRRFIEIQFNLKDFPKPTDLINQISGQRTKLNGAIVKLTLEGSKTDFTKIDYKKLNEILSTTFHYILKKNFTNRTKKRSDLTIEATPLEAFEKYLKIIKTPKNQIADLKEEAKKLIQNLE